jgi:hypothetical protein
MHLQRGDSGALATDTNASSSEAIMTTSPSTATPGALQEAHALLHREIDDLREWCHEVKEIGQPRFGQLGLRLHALREHVAEHFAEEERGGYMSPVVAADPRFAAPAAELLAEHARILERFDAVAEQLAASPPRYGCWSEGENDLCSLLADLERHEHAEIELWQTALEVDTGVSD